MPITCSLLYQPKSMSIPLLVVQVAGVLAASLLPSMDPVGTQITSAQVALDGAVEGKDTSDPRHVANDQEHRTFEVLPVCHIACKIDIHSSRADSHPRLTKRRLPSKETVARVGQSSNH